MTGAASAFIILLGFLKMKAAAVLLGPNGMGLIAIYQILIATGSTVASMGSREVGPKRIASAIALDSSQSLKSQNRAISILIFGTFYLSVAVAIALYLFGNQVIKLFSLNAISDSSFIWLGGSVIFTTLVNSIVGILAGQQHVLKIAKISAYTAAISTFLTVLSLYFLPNYSTLLFVIITPVVNVLVGLIYLQVKETNIRWSTHAFLSRSEFGSVFQQGYIVMASALAVLVFQLLVRAEISTELGVYNLGIYSSALLLGANYIAFLLSASAYDFYPKLVTSIDETALSNQLVNGQISASLTIAAPIMIFLISVSDLIVRHLLSAQFSEAASIFRLIIIADILRVTIYPISLLFLARAKNLWYFQIKLVEALGLFCMAIILMKFCDLDGLGFAHIVSISIAACLCVLASRKSCGFRISKSNVKKLILIFASCTLTNFTISHYALFGYVVGLVLSGIFSFTLLKEMSNKGD